MYHRPLITRNIDGRIDDPWCHCASDTGAATRSWAAETTIHKGRSRRDGDRPIVPVSVQGVRLADKHRALLWEASEETEGEASIFERGAVHGPARVLSTTLWGSGHSWAATAVQMRSAGNGKTSLAEISCSLKSASLCTSILNDFVVRQFPIPTSATG
jgi:hypothetical protein